MKLDDITFEIVRDAYRKYGLTPNWGNSDPNDLNGCCALAACSVEAKGGERSRYPLWEDVFQSDRLDTVEFARGFDSGWCAAAYEGKAIDRERRLNQSNPHRVRGFDIGVRIYKEFLVPKPSEFDCFWMDDEI